MTDAPDQSSIRAAVERRLARRHRAERRFQAYGIGAIALAVVFLVVLIGSIVLQAIPAFTQYTLTLPVTIQEEMADPQGDRSEQSLRAGSYNRLLQLSLQDQFPSVTGRSELRELFGLYTAVNAATLLRQVVENPDLVGETIEFSMPISDDADLYLKGLTTGERFIGHQTPIELVLDGGDATLTAQAPVFEPFLAGLREDIVAAAEAAEARARDAAARAEAAVTEDERAAAQAEAERARVEAEALRARLEEGAEIALGPQMASLMVRAGDGVVKIERIFDGGRTAEGTVLIAPDAAGTLSSWTEWRLETPPAGRRISDAQIVWTRVLEERGLVTSGPNWLLFTNADSREPELAGVRGAIIGSVLTMIVTMLMAVPVGVGTAIYLEEFAPKNRFTDLIEVNINNLAAVPSIVFGLLGLAVFINLFGMPRSAPLVGGFVLALMTLPTVIISSRAALKAVPPSIREAALGVGASRTQAVFAHVLPMAMPGIMTGSIIGLAQALGETAPLLMIGMVAFIADPPTLGMSGLTEPATVMPVQIFLWSSGAERAFEAKTAAAILILLVLMVLFNAVAIYLRRRFERRW
ncbi:phosphate ABC transporter permease PstA [Marinicauda algicola]|uniref:Phosphate transport system permease protein PstA n=1 Tax=Marinicauda algicola TaxID=2029849 RepID=A0A4S2GY06_9PROT|nr:phosphate ABC transporter permease PstA [Marinicauda algicola]TGY88110.1 phosphate ABC transporter permease PstA [Marinicauda algicola]